MREPVEIRRQRILAVVESRGAVKVSALAAELDVSVVTVRRDVEELARVGRLRRGHGVARPWREARPATVVPAPRGDEPAGRGGAVALVVPDRHTYLHETLHGARTVLEESGIRIALHIAHQSAGAERALVERALADGARGLLIAPRWRNARSEELDYGWLAGLGVPTVLMERRPRPGSALHALDSVCSDHWYGTHLAVEHLVSLGHRRIVLAARDDSPTARSIRTAFAEIAAARPEVEDWTVVLSSPDAVPGPAPDAPAAGAAGPAFPASDARTALDLAAVLRERGATAAVLHGDVDALMLVQRLAENGVDVPRDCSVVAYDDVVAALGSTPLTAVAPPKAEIGRAAAELLLHRLSGAAGASGPVRRTELLPTLEVRGSAQGATPATE
ncbi:MULTISPECIES: substrate-binding domain-containing protein [unclassified Streptomyces]|uniref:substrate-binding domain-containing protein n=1 Tax=unclassified Streptomyces TaxID=2593676 RepID=UPI00224CE7BC|nr:MULTISPECIES: substrate-binding domain-containing protein [unclassified Streptomyces]WSP59179.1 substrate-binding domain-containing protein [Streptomyces sp. NBC_01241]WSU20299.1 substrate-binding domain-containing protein [Streptomyces sp. NBC_01108]MCX4790930.1 substrate-binding domain-containing protein [Streptomyces sp. NBC_01221]MCX4793344.1 substrate-binding domain-containing protein [Streptomyces sp. NBC_01242]WSJ34785.1 substrate-binding domain-containing protein [Streptomyces sp. N